MFVANYLAVDAQDHPFEPPSLARLVLHVTPRTMRNVPFLLDVFKVTDDLMSPDFPAAREFASQSGLDFILQVLTMHPRNAGLSAAVLRVIRRLVTLEPQTIRIMIENRTVMRVVQAIHYHPWDSDVIQAASDALMAILPPDLLESTDLSEKSWPLIRTLRKRYGSIHGAHVAVGVLKCDVKAGASKATWKRRGSINDPTAVKHDDDNSVYLLKQRLVPYAATVREGLVETNGEGEIRAGHAHHNRHIQCLFASMLLFLPDKNASSSSNQYHM